jgi:hypothetical protein
LYRLSGFCKSIQGVLQIKTVLTLRHHATNSLNDAQYVIQDKERAARIIIFINSMARFESMIFKEFHDDQSAYMSLNQSDDHRFNESVLNFQRIDLQNFKVNHHQKTFT